MKKSIGQFTENKTFSVVNFSRVVASLKGFAQWLAFTLRNPFVVGLIHDIAIIFKRIFDAAENIGGAPYSCEKWINNVDRIH